jgi:putative addiction module CopG family antidote
MRSTQQFSVTLSNELAEMVRSKVESGEYASESEVIREGLRSLQHQERAIENWLRDEVAATYDAMKADASGAVTVESVRARLKNAHKAAKRAS